MRSPLGLPVSSLAVCGIRDLVREGLRITRKLSSCCH